ncbi:MAG: radical SAM protein [Candidatus Margulisiibacteriota bacterium]|jgi:MoaA/NifB/PqqE/SkfB family radical SAM enzyme
MSLKPTGLFAETIPRSLLPKSTNRSIAEAMRRLQHQDATKKNYGMYGFGKWIHHPDQVKTFLSGRLYEVTPVTAEFAPSLECDMGCPRCTYQEQRLLTAEERGRRLMDVKLAAHILDEFKAANLRGVIFSGGGEPFTHPEIIPMMRRTKSLGMQIGVFSNGTHLTKEDAIILLTELEVVFLRISLYLDKPAHLPKVLELLKFIAKVKHETKSPTAVGLGLLVNPRTSDSLATIGDLFQEIMMDGTRQVGQLDSAAFRPEVCYPWYDGTQREQYPQALFDEFIRNFEYHIVPDSQFLPNFRPLAIEERFRDINHRQQKQFGLCTANPWRISVGYDGGVHLCTEHNGNPFFRIGDFSTQSFREIWHGQRRREVLWELNHGAFQKRCPPICVKTYDNKMFWDILALNQRQLEAFLTELVILQKGTHPAHNFP